MKTYSYALSVFLGGALVHPYASAFKPVSFVRFVVGGNSDAASGAAASAQARKRQTALFMSTIAGGLRDRGGNDDDDEDEDEFDDEDFDDEDDLEMEAAIRRRNYSLNSPFTGLELDPDDPYPLIKRQPKYFEEEPDPVPPDDQLVQAMDAEERKSNLEVIRQIRNNDLEDLEFRQDYAGYVEANNDMKRRLLKDPWFGVNERIREAVSMGEPEEQINYLIDLANKLGGPPPGITLTSQPFAWPTQIYDLGFTAEDRSYYIETHVARERAEANKAMMIQRLKKREKEEREKRDEEMRFPGMKAEREAKARRERTMGYLLGKIEEKRKKQEEKLKKMTGGRLPEMPKDYSAFNDETVESALEMLKQSERKGLGGLDIDIDESDIASRIGRRKKMSGADRARAAAAAEASGGRPRLPGDKDVTMGELGELELESSSSTTTGPLTVEVSSTYNKEQSDPPMRKHCFQYTIRITNNSESDTIQLLGRRFEIQTVGSSMKDVVEGEGVTGRQPTLKPGQVFEYTSTAPLSVRPIATTIIAARMSGEYRYVTLAPGQETATPREVSEGGTATAELGMFHFIFPEDQRVKPVIRTDDDDDDDEEEEEDYAQSKASASTKPKTSTPKQASGSPASTLPGDEDMKLGEITLDPINDSSDTVTDGVRVQVTSSYRPERSDDSMEKHCFAYNVRITNESAKSIQLVSRRFEIQTIGSGTKDVVQGPGVTGRQPVLTTGESFDYTSTAPLSVRPMSDKTPVVARMNGEYNFVIMGDDGKTPISSTPLQAVLGTFHFILPAPDTA